LTESQENVLDKILSQKSAYWVALMLGEWWRIIAA